MSRKLKLAAKEKDQIKIDKFTENIVIVPNESVGTSSVGSSSANKCTLVTSISAANSPSSEEQVASAERK